MAAFVLDLMFCETALDLIGPHGAARGRCSWWSPERIVIPASSKPRIFVSSVIEGFAVYREAARQGIIQVDAEPVMVNEDFPSQNASSHNACLDAIASADTFLPIIGVRGGWADPFRPAGGRGGIRTCSQPKDFRFWS